MNSETESTSPVTPGRGHSVTVKIKGKSTEIPWGFQSPLIEGRAAKKHGIDYPATNKKEELKSDEG